jgi:hypothetical protein
MGNYKIFKRRDEINQTKQIHKSKLLVKARKETVWTCSKESG